MQDARTETGAAAPFLFLLNSLEVGGSEKKTVAIASALHRRGWPIHLAYLNPPHTLLEQLASGVPHIHLQRRDRLDWRAVRALRGYVRRHRIQAIHCINRYPMIYGYIAAPRGVSGRNYTVYLNSTKLPNRVEQAKMLLYGPILRRARRVVFGCRYQQELWSRQYRLPQGRYGYLYNGVRTDLFDPDRLPPEQRRLRAQLGWSERDVVVGMVGQLRPQKGYPDFIAACAALRRSGLALKVLVVGDGSERGSLERLAQASGLGDDIRFVGELADVRPALYAMDVFALTSKSETFSNAALEAMAMARPVVLSRLGGAAEMVDEGRCGYIYPVGNVECLAAQLRRLVEDAEHRREVGRAARRRVLERFTFERMVDGYAAELRALRPGLEPLVGYPSINE